MSTQEGTQRHGADCWEYLAREVQLRDAVNRDLLLDRLTAACNELGREGWELAGVTPSETGSAGLLSVPTARVVLIFKRRVRSFAVGPGAG